MNKHKKVNLLFFFMIGFVLQCIGQYLPKDGAKLNYNQIYFEYPYHPQASNYKLYLATDSVNSKINFKTYIDNTPATRVSGLKFGQNYKWYVETTLKSGEKINSDFHYFSVLSTIYTDTNYFKRTVNYKYPTDKDNGIIWCDLSHSAFDRNGNLVWFMPTENIEYSESTRVRDLKLYKDGTITFIKNPDVIHTTIGLDEIWRAPLSGENFPKFKNGYHHSFMRRENGNYMALAYDYVELERTDEKDTTANNVELVNLIEFNENKEIVWIWEMRDHFPFDILAIPKENNRSIINAHANSFSIDKDNRYAYIGFRDISRVVKINMQTKKIEASYGKKLNNADSLVTITPFFASQHDAQILPDNNIMVINNNDVMGGKISSLEIFNQPNTKKTPVKNTWHFNFNFDSLNSGKSLKFGNVKILDNGNYLVNVGSGNRIFEITKNKKIVWDMMLFLFDSKKKKWISTGPYKVDYSSSLYPFFFSAGIKKKSQNSIIIEVFNEGDYEDFYECELFDESQQKKLAVTKSNRVSKKGKTSINFKIETQGKYKIIIKSLKSKKTKELSYK